MVTVASEIESLLLEANYIKKYNTPYNIRLADGKAYPLIRITIKDEYPKVLIARRTDDRKSLYFGPFPNAGAMKLVLKTIRHIFPFQSVLHHQKRACLYYHLGLCPCPEVFKDKEYKKTIKQIIHFLEGKTKVVLRDLEKQRDKVAKNEEFEIAEILQKKIDAMKLIVYPVHTPLEYDTNPNLLSDIRKREIDNLMEELTKKGTAVSSLKRIECYDISNISGTNAVGSMVVFTNGEKNSSEYRRFKIYQTQKVPNDFAMMQEVLQRRIKHTEWPYPDLIIVDGGKGQISSATKVLDEQHLDIPLIGLAKREETIITSDFKEIKLPKNTPALFLMMRIRDEAHRFAITYHRKLRSKLALI